VAVKVEQDKIIVRVGGGFMTIDQFIDQYTLPELEKAQNRDGFKKLSEKILV